MKRYSLIYSVIALVVVITLFDSCKKQTPSRTDKMRQMLMSGTWKINNVTVEGVNKNDLFSGFTLLFTADQFTTVNGEPVWPASGSWAFVDDTAKSFSRNDGIIVSITSISNTSMVLELTWNETTLGSGRTTSVSGDYVFEFTK